MFDEEERLWQEADETSGVTMGPIGGELPAIPPIQPSSLEDDIKSMARRCSNDRERDERKEHGDMFARYKRIVLVSCDNESLLFLCYGPLPTVTTVDDTLFRHLKGVRLTFYIQTAAWLPEYGQFLGLHPDRTRYGTQAEPYWITQAVKCEFTPYNKRADRCLVRIRLHTLNVFHHVRNGAGVSKTFEIALRIKCQLFRTYRMAFHSAAAALIPAEREYELLGERFVEVYRNETNLVTQPTLYCRCVTDKSGQCQALEMRAHITGRPSGEAPLQLYVWKSSSTSTEPLTDAEQFVQEYEPYQDTLLDVAMEANTAAVIPRDLIALGFKQRSKMTVASTLDLLRISKAVYLKTKTNAQNVNM